MGDDWVLDSSIFHLIADWRWSREEKSGVAPCARRGHTCVYFNAISPYLAVVGGFYGYSKFLNDFYLLNLESRKWERTPIKGVNLPGLAWHSANVVKTKMFITGGMTSEITFNDQIFMVNLIDMTWTSLKLETKDFLPKYSHSSVVSNGKDHLNMYLQRILIEQIL